MDNFVRLVGRRNLPECSGVIAGTCVEVVILDDFLGISLGSSIGVTPAPELKCSIQESSHLLLAFRREKYLKFLGSMCCMSFQLKNVKATALLDL